MIAYEADTAGKILLLIMQTLNQGVYSLINTLCQLFVNISKTSLFNNDIMNDFLSRIYVVLGILMLFKLAFSLLTSIVNPDNLVDKQKGMQKIIPRTVITLILLIFVPTIFGYAMEWQNDIAMAVPRIIIGKSNVGDELSESNEGELLAATALKTFVNENSECDNISDDLDNATSVSDVLYVTGNRCNGTGKTYMYQFNGFISLIVGIFLVVFLASYCIDIAIRVIKIGILRILAPIPIISYIDPKSEKSGAFGNWVKECISTYLELFIKLGILYFVLYILGGIASGDNGLFNFPDVSGTSKAFIKLFIIMGAFFFMGKAADFICNVVGVKKPDSNGGMFKGLAAAAMLGGAVSTGVNRFQAGQLADQAKGVKEKGLINRGAHIAKNIAKGAIGGVTGFATAGYAASKAKGIQQFTSANKKIMEANAKAMTRGAHGGTWLGDVIDTAGVYFGTSSNSDVIQYQLAKENELMKFINDKGGKKGKTLGLTADNSNENYNRLKKIFGQDLNFAAATAANGHTIKYNPNSTNNSNLDTLLQARAEALGKFQATGNTSDAEFSWAGKLLNANDANLDYLISEVTTFAGTEHIRKVMASGSDEDKAEIKSVLKAAGKTEDKIIIDDIKKSITQKENAIRSLKK